MERGKGERDLAFSSSNTSMQADTAQITERSRQTGPAVEWHARSRHVRIPGTLCCFRSWLCHRQLPVSVAMPTSSVGWTAQLIVEQKLQRLQFYFICIITEYNTTFREKKTTGTRIYTYKQLNPVAQIRNTFGPPYILMLHVYTLKPVANLPINWIITH